MSTTGRGLALRSQAPNREARGSTTCLLVTSSWSMTRPPLDLPLLLTRRLARSECPLIWERPSRNPLRQVEPCWLRLSVVVLEVLGKSGLGLMIGWVWRGGRSRQTVEQRSGDGRL